MCASPRELDITRPTDRTEWVVDPLPVTELETEWVCLPKLRLLRERAASPFVECADWFCGDCDRQFNVQSRTQALFRI